MTSALKRALRVTPSRLSKGKELKLPYLFNSFVRLKSDVRNIGIHHEREQVQDQVGVPEEVEDEEHIAH